MAYNKKADEDFQKQIESLTKEQLSWLGGLFQGKSYLEMDYRKTEEYDDKTYVPPPPTPFVKIEMIEKDLMDHIGSLLGKEPKKQKRRTTAGNSVYRISFSARYEVAFFLKTIRPYVSGEKTKSRIDMLLKAHKDYQKWVENGGRSKAAKIANKASQKSKQNNASVSNDNGKSAGKIKNLVGYPTNPKIIISNLKLAITKQQKITSTKMTIARP